MGSGGDMTGFDPDLDATVPPPAVAQGDAAAYRRVVANPLLAIVALLGVWALFRHSLAIRNLALFLASLFAAAVSLLLIQYHCLDCGRTDFALWARRHACAGVVRRVRSGEEPPSFPPALRTQVKAWALAIFLGLLLYAIFRNAA